MNLAQVHDAVSSHTRPRRIRADAAHKPSVASDGHRKRSQVLVSSESSHRVSVKSMERASSYLASAAASKSSSVSMLAEKPLRQKVDLT